MASKKNTKQSTAEVKKTASDVQMTFSRKNYIFLLIGVLVIFFGFFLLSLDGFVDAQKFSVSLNIAPYVIVGGFVWVIYAIMFREKEAA
jgi:hypothetical protein